ncbi:hypothetical protein [Sandaracinus amylolyticus]|uniref:hypothetical protein n=1 Tax=Sandaracinus amylolyticus TaxID=927083 RepID=UPI001F18EC99|nr:hypothetical protein [Sandaracinus amylolyticus]UJR80208.1 Hypothetical protein I5071_22520 [Sandaracinus amylolyticus]
MRATSTFADPARPAPAFLDATGGALLFGRVLLFRGLGDAFLATWDRWQTIVPGDLALVPAHDLSRFEEYRGFDGCFRVVVGVEVATASADEGPSPPFDAAAITRARERATRSLDAHTVNVLAATLGAHDALALRAQPTRALLVPYGPIASVHLAHGVIAAALATPPPGLTRVRGADMRERPHRDVVHGALLASACDWDIAEPDLDAAPGAAGRAFHLIARYG